MRVRYDEEVDALYLELGNQKPNGAVEVMEGINIDTTEDGRLIGIEILHASRKIDIDNILSGTSMCDFGARWRNDSEKESRQTGIYPTEKWPNYWIAW